MNALLFTDVDYESDDSWGGFELAHGLTHQTVYEALLYVSDMTTVPVYYPLYVFPRRGNNEYLLNHYYTHLANARVLGIVGLPDLSTVDLEDDQQRDDWMKLHADVHAAENAILQV